MNKLSLSYPTWAASISEEVWHAPMVYPPQRRHYYTREYESNRDCMPLVKSVKRYLVKLRNRLTAGKPTKYDEIHMLDRAAEKCKRS